MGPEINALILDAKSFINYNQINNIYSSIILVQRHSKNIVNYLNLT